MKKISAAALVAFILCFSAVRTGAAERLTVTGHGGISVPADTVTVSFSVDVRAASLADSQKKAMRSERRPFWRRKSTARFPKSHISAMRMPPAGNGVFHGATS